MSLTYTPTPDLLKLTSLVSEKLGEANARFPIMPPPQLRKVARIDTIHTTLGLDGNPLAREKIAALTNNYPVRGPQKRIHEVTNTIKVYELLKELNPWLQDSFLSTHCMMLSGISEDPGQFRTIDTGIFRGSEIIRLAPPPKEVPKLMNELFEYIINGEDPLLIKSCLFHCNVESIQPFLDGSGRMGRLWQTLLLINKHPLFEFLPCEKRLSKNSKEYFRALSASDRVSNATEFILFMLHMILETVTEFLDNCQRTETESDRLLSFHQMGMISFTRKDYLGIFKSISTATASRDLEKGVNGGLFEKYGTKNRTTYSCRKLLE